MTNEEMFQGEAFECGEFAAMRAESQREAEAEARYAQHEESESFSAWLLTEQGKLWTRAAKYTRHSFLVSSLLPSDLLVLAMFGTDPDCIPF